MALMRTLVFVMVATLSLVVSGQVADSKKDNSPRIANNQQLRQGSLAEQAERGEIPYSFAYSGRPTHTAFRF